MAFGAEISTMTPDDLAASMERATPMPKLTAEPGRPRPHEFIRDADVGMVCTRCQYSITNERLALFEKIFGEHDAEALRNDLVCRWDER